MPVLKQFLIAHIEQAGEDESKSIEAVTCFGLPGSSGLKPSMSSCHFEVKVAVYEDESVYVGINGQISDPVVAADDYTVMLAISPKPFSLDGGKATGDGVVTYKEATIDATDGSAGNAPSWASGQTAYDASRNPYPGATYGWLKWDMGAANALDGSYPTGAMGYKKIGSLRNFGADSDGKNGVMYIGGTGTYTGTNYVYPSPVKVTIPGFITPAVISDYYPFAIRKSNAWASANRSGGSTAIWKSSSWRDVKNYENGSSVQGYYWSGGKWARAPKFP